MSSASCSTQSSNCSPHFIYCAGKLEDLFRGSLGSEAPAPTAMVYVRESFDDLGSVLLLHAGELNVQLCRRYVGRLFDIRSARRHLKIAFKSSISIQSRRRSLLHLLLSSKTRHSHRPAHVFFLEHPRSVAQMMSRLVILICGGAFHGRAMEETKSYLSEKSSRAQPQSRNVCCQSFRPRRRKKRRTDAVSQVLNIARSNLYQSRVDSSWSRHR